MIVINYNKCTIDSPEILFIQGRISNNTLIVSIHSAINITSLKTLNSLQNVSKKKTKNFNKK